MPFDFLTTRGRNAATRALTALVVALLLLVSPTGASQEHPRPILMLVSFDGWRWDYIDRAAVPNLKALASGGVRARELVPVFPSLTFPNHYTIVTGLYPEHHGIVSNVMEEPGFPERFTTSSETARDSRWWGGEPIWVTAVRQGRPSATMFWPGADAAIGGVRPTYWKPFDAQMPNAARVQQVLEWLAIPGSDRPALVTLYFDEVDHAGHDFGPDSAELLEAAAHLDLALGQLVSGIHRLGLQDRTTIVVVSDHGMTPLAPDRSIFLDDFVDMTAVTVVEAGGTLQIAPRSGSIEALYQQLHGKHHALAVYRRQDLPADLHYRDNSRIQPIVGIADEGWSVTWRGRRRDAPVRGGHGYDPRLRSMHGLFVAAGPDLARGVIVPELRNIHLYEFLCRVIGLTPARNDGDPSVTRKFFK